MNDAALVDTNILISFYNHGLHSEKLLQLNRQSLFLVSAVTLNEFVRGAHDRSSKEIAKSFSELMKGHVVTPSEKHWMECARISERLLHGKKRTKQEVLLLQNDILISLGARDSQARLITADRTDFEIIRRHVDMEVEYW